MSGLIRVLHVDDEPDFADLTATYLERTAEQFDVETATSAADGLDRLADTNYDCIVSDYEMPGMDGIDFLETVREEYPDLPFILFTGKGSEEVAGEAIRTGVTDYLQKEHGTSQYELLANRIHNAVESSRAERRARLTEREYRRLFEQAPIMYVLVRDERGWPLIEDCNEEFLDTLGYERGDVIGRPTTDFFSEDSTKKVYDGGGFERALAGEFDLEERTLVTKDGEQIDTTLRASPRLDADGNVVGLQTIYLDVTERKQREQQLRTERDRLAALFEDAPRPILESKIDQDEHRIVGVNDAFGAVFGYEREEIVGNAVPETLVPDADRTDHERLRARVAAGEATSVEVERTTADGDRTFLLDVVPYGADETPADGAFATYTDITERNERTRRLELALEYTRSGVWEYDPASERVTRHEGASDLWADNAEMTVPMSHAIEERVHPADRDTIRRALEATVTDGEPYHVEFRHRTPDGYRWAEARGELSPDAEDTSEQLIAVTTDIHERKRREEELELYETIVETVPDGVYALDENLEFILVNQALADLTGYSTDELTDSHLSLVNDEVGIESAKRNREQLLDDDGNVTTDVKTLEHELLTADGEEIECEARFRALSPDDDGEFRGTAGVVRDTSERKRRERELERQNDRLERFASVVSHDLRNPLRVAEGNVELASEECDSEHLGAVDDALDRMDTLIADLLTLARQGKTVEETDAVALADVAGDGWHDIDTDDATFVVETDATIRADRSRLRQLLANLFGNSVEHGGDGVTVTVGNLADGSGFYVADDGPGISADERDRIFERGYSNADEGGTGFGLAIVAEIANAHGWDVRATESEHGGARFEIRGVEPA